MVGELWDGCETSKNFIMSKPLAINTNAVSKCHAFLFLFLLGVTKNPISTSTLCCSKAAYDIYRNYT